MSAELLWGIALGLGVVVIAVVAVLLALIVRSAGRIRGTVAEIWVVGPRIAANTAQIDLVRRINLVAADILAGAGAIAANATRLLAHAERCPGCPRCVLSGRPGAPGGAA